ncbi:SDR family NAD(P)-dependent oxidoreductase [Bifidobacterium eulemuris]|uniref:Oxidoreductase, short chain dehydrogenase/reductase family protein n=1 Tax=Bifidobacterium eulemuris TaxID=1765219 RepID=A0A261GA98_9BIFI|nr:SDR family oxidoreductase [Bifidobacterium eulemuris]OZG68163.1 oxidoreductase, short chain dehydrogenase/reductase family protein [Bifidobacterium eulemuris]QOL31776.1 SDR family oxidoreductase [Bifidobacterium eulemuris]
MGYALVTGASSGIGRELAVLFAADGYDLILAARDEARLNQVRSVVESRYGVRVVVFPVDLSEADAPRRLHDFTNSHGLTVEALVNNAGFADWAGFLDADWNRQHAMMELNMVALADLTYRYGRDMREAGRGRILNISSISSMMAGPWMAMYFASKAFVCSFSEAVAHELRGTGVSVTCVCPGPTSTGFAKAASMGGRNFFTVGRPANARRVAEYAYRRMMRGDVLVYHGHLTKAGAVAERLLPRAVTRRLAAVANGGDPLHR